MGIFRDQLGRNAPGAARIVYLLMTYNQEEFVGDAVVSALAQDYAPLEIVVSDDSSTDATWATVEACVAAYRGPHEVRLNRNATRMGSVEHLAHAVSTIGDDAFIVMAHGDDVAAPKRTSRLVEAWQRERVTMVSSGSVWLDSRGSKESKDQSSRPSRLITAADIIENGWTPEMLGAAMAFEAAVLTAFDPLTSETLGWGLDHVLPLRAAVLKGFYYLAEPLISYRRHTGNMSNFISDRTGELHVLDEGLLAYQLALRPVQREDLYKIARAKAVSPRLWLLLWKIEQKIIVELARWARLRASLKTKGLAPIWVEAREVEARKIVREAQF